MSSESISDKAWSLAEWLEAKGLPLASFCDKHNINPLLLFSIVLVAVVLLLMLTFGAFSGVSYGTLTITVTSSGNPAEGATVYYEFAGERHENTTNFAGKAELEFPIGPEITVYATKTGYKQASKQVSITEDRSSVSLSLERRVGTLEVAVDSSFLPEGAYVVVNGDGVALTEPVRDGKATFENVPADVDLTLYLKVGSQSIPPGGMEVKVAEGETTRKSIAVPESALRTSVEVRVRDSLYQDINNANVQLYDWNTGTPIGDPQTTYNGYVTFEVPIGKSIYAVVSPPGNQYASYNGKVEGNRLDITRSGLAYEVVLEVVGRVDICVYDESGSPLMAGTVKLWGTDGTSYGTTTIDEECESFYGLPEGLGVYPEVNVPNYAQHMDSSEAKIVDYSTITRFDITMHPLGAGQGVDMYVHVSDCDGNSIDGINVRIVDASTLTILADGRTECLSSPALSYPCGNMKSQQPLGKQVYAIAFDEDYQLGRSNVDVVAQDTVLDITTCRATEDNTGAFHVCVYKDGQPFNGAQVELYNGDGYLLWTAKTDEDEDNENNCHTFKNIPDGSTVYAKAVNIGANPEVSQTVGITAGETANGTIVSGSEPVILEKGDVNICVRNEETNTSMVANVTLYDALTDRAIISGETAGGGCRLFQDLDAETNSGGRILPREVYVVVKKPGYGTFSNKDKPLQMVPNGELDITAYLSESFEICVQVRDSVNSKPAKAKVILYYNESGTDPIAEEKTDANGTVHFYEKELDTYYFKIDEDYTLYDPLPIYELDKEDVSGGSCGILTIYDLGSLCKLGIEVLGSSNMSFPLGDEMVIPLRILEDGKRADSSITNEGSQANLQTIQLENGEEVNLTFKLDNNFQTFSLSYESTEYSPDQEIVLKATPKKAGNYSAVIDVVENELCRRQASFPLRIFKENLLLDVDEVVYDPVAEKNAPFCIYVTDQDGNKVDDARVTLLIDEMDGWLSTATREAKYDEVRECYRGTLTSSMAPKTPGSYIFRVKAVRGKISKIAEFEAQIQASDLCGNGIIDQGEQCDPAAYPNGCSQGYVCSSCTCVQESKGALRISADKATISIGSGRTSGFCVHVSDSGGEVRDARVTANFYSASGWPVDTSVSTSYDIARGCYYVPISDNVALPRGRPARSRSDLLGQKSVSVVAVQGQRTATTTTTVTVTCGCDEEKWCEWNCPCDEDCENAGNLQLLTKCLQLASQQGYSPGPPGAPSPYPYIAAPGMISAGGITAGGGTIGITSPSGTYMGVNWEECKKLFKNLGWFGFDKGIVYVKDDAGLITGDPSSGSCKTLVDYLKTKKNFKYIYVDNRKNKCCTKKYGGFLGMGGKCDKQEFEKLMETALEERDVAVIYIKGLDNSVLREFGLYDNYRVIEGTGGSVLYALQSGGLYGKGAVLFTDVPKAPGANNPKADTYYLLGVLDKNAQFLDLVRSDLPAILEARGVRYPSGLLQTKKGDGKAKGTPNINQEEYTTILVGSPPTGLKGVDITNAQYATGMFTKIADKTKLYVFTSFDSYASRDMVKHAVGSLAHTYPKFKTLDPEKETEKIRYCKEDGSSDYYTEEHTMLRLNDDLYMVSGGADKYCSYVEKNKIKTKNPPSVSGIGYVIKDGNKVLCMAGDSGSVNTVCVNDNIPDEDGTKVIGTDYSLIFQQCRKEHVCAKEGATSLSEFQDPLAQLSGISLENVPGGNLDKTMIVPCICVGTAKDPATKIQFTVNKDSVSCDGNPTAYLTYHDRKDGTWKVLHSPMTSTGSTYSTTFEVHKDELKEGENLYVWAKCTNGDNCYGTKRTPIKYGDLVPGVVEPVSATLLQNDGFCGETLTKENYHIYGTVRDASNNPIPELPLSIEGCEIKTDTKQNNIFYTKGRGHFDINCEGYPGVKLGIKIAEDPFSSGFISTLYLPSASEDVDFKDITIDNSLLFYLKCDKSIYGENPMGKLWITENSNKLCGLPVSLIPNIEAQFHLNQETPILWMCGSPTTLSVLPGHGPNIQKITITKSDGGLKVTAPYTLELSPGPPSPTPHYTLKLHGKCYDPHSSYGEWKKTEVSLSPNSDWKTVKTFGNGWQLQIKWGYPYVFEDGCSCPIIFIRCQRGDSSSSPPPERTLTPRVTHTFFSFCSKIYYDTYLWNEEKIILFLPP